jgi:hypothetical protein
VEVLWIAVKSAHAIMGDMKFGKFERFCLPEMTEFGGLPPVSK